MDNRQEQEDRAIDLGAATEETKGPIAPNGDTMGQSLGGGLSND